MKQFTIKKQAKPWEDDIGDVLAGGEYVKCMLEPRHLQSSRVIGLSWLRSDPWSGLAVLGVAMDAKLAFRYECPWTGNEHWHFMPQIMFVDPEREKFWFDRFKELNPNDWHDMSFDDDWIRQHTENFYQLDKWEPTDTSRIFRGHGYTDGTLPMDGGGHWELACLELETGDLIAGWLWVWFNK